MSRRALSADDGSMRLAKRVAELKGCSRSDAERYIEGGWVSVNDQVVEEPALRVTHETVTISPDATLLDGGPITLLPGDQSGSRRGRSARRYAFGPGSSDGDVRGLQIDLSTFSGDVRLVRASRF